MEEIQRVVEAFQNSSRKELSALRSEIAALRASLETEATLRTAVLARCSELEASNSSLQADVKKLRKQLEEGVESAKRIAEDAAIHPKRQKLGPGALKSERDGAPEEQQASKRKSDFGGGNEQTPTHRSDTEPQKTLGNHNEQKEALNAQSMEKSTAPEEAPTKKQSGDEENGIINITVIPSDPRGTVCV